MLTDFSVRSHKFQKYILRTEFVQGTRYDHKFFFFRTAFFLKGLVFKVRVWGLGGLGFIYLIPEASQEAFVLSLLRRKLRRLH